jgi:hypothetical protein
MIGPRFRHAFRLAAIAVALLGPARPTVFGQAAPPRNPLVVVVAQDSPVRDLSFSTLRAMFLGDSVITAGVKLTPLNHPPNSVERVAFDRKVLHMDPDRVGAYWTDRRVRGESRPPRNVDSVLLLKRVVARFPGAISYVRANQIEAGLRVVRIDGKTPDDRGYPLAD